MLVAGPSYGLGSRPLSLCDSTTSVGKSSISGSSSNSSRYSLIKSFAEHLNRGTELIKKILPTKKNSPNSSVQLLSPSKIHRSEDTPESDSGDSLKTEICHFEPICKMPQTPKNLTKFNQSVTVKHPKPRPIRTNSINRFKPPKILKKIQYSPYSAFIKYSKILECSQSHDNNIILPIVEKNNKVAEAGMKIQKLTGSQNGKRKLSLSSLDLNPHSNISGSGGGKRKKIESILTTKNDEDNQNNNKIYNLRQKQTKQIIKSTEKLELKPDKINSEKEAGDLSSTNKEIIALAPARRSNRIKKSK